MSAVQPPYEQLANRFRRVHRHLRKWARRSAVTCYRLYEKDIPDQPLIVDWYDGAAVVWAYARTRNETPEQEEEWLAAVLAAVCAGLDLEPGAVFLKRRFRQLDRQEGEGQYQRLDHRRCTKVIAEQGLSFEVNLSDYLDTGIFLDHRPLRALVRAEAAEKRVLNLFAYTGTFTCYARAGGARATTTVDLSQTYLAWAGRNCALNGQPTDRDHLMVRADCLAWLGETGHAQRYDLIICDPPTFSNSTAMQQSFSIERDYLSLLALCRTCLNPGGTLFFSTNCRTFRLDSGALPGLVIEDLTSTTIPEDFRNRRIHSCWRMRLLA